MNGTTPDGKIITRRMREKQLGREAVSAAALIMILTSFSVGLQLIMVEFVMTGTCAIPRNIAGVFLAMILTITAGLRALVAAFLSLDGMCELGCASRSCHDVVNSESCYEVLMNEVKSTGLEQRWERHVHHKVTMGESESSSSSADVSTPEVITDVVRYCMLVIGWFWFSAEVMDMACLEGGGLWQVIKAVSSPCLFIFILESDRNHVWSQVAAGLVAAVLLLDLLFS